ncbi:tRNA dihydrouridine(20/20a) synthase DusA [Methylococcus sp. EFPC2]|uniref:tRNA dihydrouridine(20/20a) synthase DusA n=1 Tax=Methylococcus sp. EFPC2 TaxID=2812648 RepID=UPI001F077E5F|nr:tRNA dihydrouridine(20/20a) synthase DusA [Methylococcus sp. EFPC2]
MLEWTDRHCRYFLRQISRHALLYTEMVTTGAVLRGDRERLLGFDPAEKPLALQLGGSDPATLAESTRIAEAMNYDEVNLNVGCPSDRVQNGRFGACLMAEPKLVADCIAAMQAATRLPVTVKTRIGIDERDSYQELAHFVDTVALAGCNTFIIHARKAWLQGLSPKENREIPPLRYDVARQLKRDFPHLVIVLNGGIQNLAEARAHLEHFDGVMIGRAAYHDPYILAEADSQIFGDEHAVPTRHEILHTLLPYVERQLSQGVRLQSISRHILGLFHGTPGGRRWRRHISENAHKAGAGIDVLKRAEELCGPHG